MHQGFERAAGRFGRAAGWVCLFVLAACHADAPVANDRFAWREAAPAKTDSLTDVGAFEFLGYLTDSSGPGSIERVSSVGPTDREGVVAVADFPACQVMLLHVRTRSRVGALGRCGEGPAEYRYIAGIELRHDSLYTLDADRQQVQVLGPDGTEARRFRLADHFPDGSGKMVWGSLLTPTTFLMVRSSNGVDVAASSIYPHWRTPIMILTAGGNTPPSVHGASLQIPEAAEESIRRAAFVHPVRACAQRGFVPDRSGHVVAVHRFGIEAAIIDASLRPSARTRTAAPWTLPVADSTRPGGYRLGIDRAYLACGKETFAYGVRAFDGGDERTVDTNGRLEIRRYDGTLVAARSWTAATFATAGLGTPGALMGDTLITLRVDEGGLQRVAAWRVRP